MAELGVLDTTLQKTHEWLRDIKEELGFDNDHAAYAALRATLHGLRDQLATDHVARFGAQLPMLVRGIYYEGWDPPSPAAGGRERPDFLESLRHELRDHPELRDTERAARIVFSVIAMHVAPGEVRKISHALPRELRALWPQKPPQRVQ